MLRIGATTGTAVCKRFLVSRLINRTGVVTMATQATPQSLEHEQLFSDVTSLIREYLIKYSDRSTKVVVFKSPDELRKLMNFDLPEEGVSDETILQLCRTALDYSVHTAHPRFYNQLFSGVDEMGMLGLFLSAATNTSMYTFEMAPVFSLMESQVLQKMRELIGWRCGDGLFSPGGSISNLYAFMAARYHRFPETKTKGVSSLPQMTVFASEQVWEYTASFPDHSSTKWSEYECHYSAQKSAIIMGIGTDHVIRVKCDKRGKMIVEDLEKKIAEVKSQGMCPLVVMATAGTTVLGAFDPINEIADVCEKHSVWLHVDGAFGASVLVSRTHRKLVDGIERVDSVTWNPHKSLNVPLQCSAILLQHNGVLQNCNSTRADYLFQQDKVSYDVSYDTGDKSIQCGRLNDVFKLWLMWKQKGTSGFEQRIDHSIELAKYLAGKIKEREGFELVVEPEYTHVPFWYIPPCLRQCSDGQERRQRLAKVAPIVKARMVAEGTMMMNYQPLQDLPNFLRMTLTAPRATKEDMDFVLDEVERLGRDIDV